LLRKLPQLRYAEARPDAGSHGQVDREFRSAERRDFPLDFVVEVLLEHPSRPGPLPIQASDDGTGLFYHVPIDSGWKVVATAWPIDGSGRSGTAMVGEIQPGKTTTVTVQLDLR